MLLSLLLQATAQMSGAGLVKGIATLAAAIVVIGAGMGISKIGVSTMDAIARQPQSASDIRTSMIIIGALVEGVALFAVLVCFVAVSQ